ncbi:MAG TPA: CPBP family intramembrane glutamic endopeptidase [Dehalococcoidia bacterium]
MVAAVLALVAGGTVYGLEVDRRVLPAAEPRLLLLQLAGVAAILATARLLPPAPPEAQPPVRRPRLELCLFGGYCLLLAYALVQVRRYPVPLAIPGYLPLANLLEGLARPWLGALGLERLSAGGLLVLGLPHNAAAFALAPLAAARLMGYAPAALGLRAAGVRLGLAYAAAAAAAIAVLGHGPVDRQLPLPLLALVVALSAGFTEEVLYRGILQPRLEVFLGPAGGLAAQALLFGLAHVGANWEAVGPDAPAILARCLAVQTAGGLAFGYLYLRTRSILAPGLVHTAVDVAFIEV